MFNIHAHNIYVEPKTHYNLEIYFQNVGQQAGIFWEPANRLCFDCE